ncbi:PIN domain-containing protein [Haloferula sp. A504]|uniref:PIN domain-containing protein n=1 Tax=Haloferula sp. A504 TaxID=3373601 RepID=UPI0031C8E739|nr:PIN domain-containing protein [Verrucomicrobiaceae bacterium E54]
MGLILDSSVIIAAERGKFDLEGLLEAYRDEPVRIAAVTASELLHGWERAPAGARRDRRRGFVEGLLKILPAAPFDLDCARVHAQLWARLEDQGVMIGAHDLLIAATCVREGDAIATLNDKEFSRIAELILADCGRWVM